MIRIRCSREIRLVARITGSRRVCVIVVSVALDTGKGGVRAG